MLGTDVDIEKYILASVGDSCIKWQFLKRKPCPQCNQIVRGSLGGLLGVSCQRRSGNVWCVWFHHLQFALSVSSVWIWHLCELLLNEGGRLPMGYYLQDFFLVEMHEELKTWTRELDAYTDHSSFIEITLYDIEVCSFCKSSKTNCPCSYRRFELFTKPVSKEDKKQDALVRKKKIVLVLSSCRISQCWDEHLRGGVQPPSQLAAWNQPVQLALPL